MYRRTLLCCALTILPILAAGDASLDRGTLRGLKGFSVVIDKLDPALEQEGITMDTLQSHLEDQLKKAGIAIDAKAVEFVGLRITSTRPAKKAPYTLCLMIGLYQPVILSRNKEIRTATQTWEVDSLLVAPAKTLISSSTEAVDSLAARFVAAWKSVN